MMTAEEKRAQEITTEIDTLKKQLTERSGCMSNQDIETDLVRIGELLNQKSELTGMGEEAQYLYSDDGEWMREVVGFVGDDAGITDCNGVPLKFGDTVGLLNEDGSVYPRIVMHGLPGEETMREKSAVKLKDYTEMDMHDSFCAAFTISLHSCVEDYENSLDREMEIKQ